MSQSFQLKHKQVQQLNQTMQQSLRVLQMSGIELEREVEDWLEDNPLLERQETPEVALEPSRLSAATPSSNQVGGDDAEDIWSTIAAEEDFIDYMHKQVCEHPLNDIQAARVHILIDFLDDQGYLKESLSEVIDNTPLEWMLEEDDLQEALDCLQNFDPAGVAAKDLADSLLLQLQRLPVSLNRQCAAKIVETHLDEIGYSQAQNIVKFKKNNPEYESATVQTALNMLSNLNPYPAYGFASPEPTAYVQPDVWVREEKSEWMVVYNQAAWPNIHLNRDFCEALEAIDEVDKIWKEKLQEAKQKLETLHLRKSTVLRLAEYVVRHQQDFFVFGEIGLVPMLLKDAAQALELAESTISRAVNHKYLACPRGVFALSYFFSQAVSAADGEEGTSQNAVKAMIAQLIEDEDKKKPYSDEALSKLLKLQGVDIARRTVAKYREVLDIPPTSQRKVNQVF